MKDLPNPHIVSATVLLQIHPRLYARQIYLPGEVEAISDLTGQARGDDPLVVEVAGGTSLLEEPVAVDLGPLDNTVVAGEGGLVGGTVQVVHRTHRLVGLPWVHHELTILRLETL